MTRRAEVEALKRTTLANGLFQLALHFPARLETLGIDVARALEHALALTEEALELAPSLPEPHLMLGRLLLVHEGRRGPR